jgi:spermidine synthase
MRPWEIIDYADVPEDDGRMLLVNRGSEWAVYVDDRQLMTNREHGSEDALADLACDRLDPAHLPIARILVGGMGMGFTLAAALRRVGPQGHVTVAELIPEVVSWNRDYKAGKASGYPLNDPRTGVHLGDVGDLIARPPEPWSAILLDVDNGPNHLTRPNNGWLYQPQGLDLAWDALIPGGILGIWSAASDPAFTRRLRKKGFETELLHHTEEGRPTPDSTGTHALWMARRPCG